LKHEEQKSEISFLKVDLILAIENPQKHFILARLIFKLFGYHFIYIYMVFGYFTNEWMNE
jgi:hypothetical protein